VSITLEGITFDERHTTVKDRYEELGGRQVRCVTVSGLIVGASDVAAIEAALDAILDAASVDDFSAALSVRAGRQLWVQRNAFTREIAAEKLVGSFELELDTRAPYEESISGTTVVWNIAASGDQIVIASGGNAPTDAVVTLTAVGDIINPTFSDGQRTITYSGIVSDGQVLKFDGANRQVLLDNADVTPYTDGLFPQLIPEGSTLTYSDDATSSHSANVTVAYNSRWW